MSDKNMKINHMHLNYINSDEIKFNESKKQFTLKLSRENISGMADLIYKISEFLEILETYDVPNIIIIFEVNTAILTSSFMYWLDKHIYPQLRTLGVKKIGIVTQNQNLNKIIFQNGSEKFGIIHKTFTDTMIADIWINKN